MPSNIVQIPVTPRVIRPAPPPLGLYFRPGWNEHKDVLSALEAGKTAFFGVVFDPARLDRQKELRERVLTLRLEAILDPRTQASALPGGYSTELGALPWGAGRQHAPADFQGPQQRKIANTIAAFANQHGFTAVIAPTHFIQSANDRWLSIDAGSARSLWNELNRSSGRRVPIFYSLALSSAAFRDREQREAIIHALVGLPISALWLKVDGFGVNASPTALRIYIDALSDFHQLGIPIVADQVGGLIGLSALAFGSVGGLSHGVTNGEQFSARSWMNKRSGDAFSPRKRVYFPDLDMMLKPEQAKTLLERSARTRALFGCNDPLCCPRGVTDMLQNPGQHFIHQRIEQISHLSRIPADVRTQRFLDKHIRSATDKALAVANIGWKDEALSKKTQQLRKRLDNLRIALGQQALERPGTSYSSIPETRASREAKP